MAKFKVGDKCRVIKNLLSPQCIGDIVEITGCINTDSGRTIYAIYCGNIRGYASEKCLELVKQ